MNYFVSGALALHRSIIDKQDEYLDTITETVHFVNNGLRLYMSCSLAHVCINIRWGKRKKSDIDMSSIARYMYRQYISIMVTVLGVV